MSNQIDFRSRDTGALERPLALVLGATGGVGGAIAARLAERGYRIRAMSRDPGRARQRLPHYEWIAGDAMRREDVMSAARGAELIVHGVNPPHYNNWDKLVLPMIDSTIAAARQSGALIVMPGTVYNYGPDALPLVGETAPQHPLSRKGAIRVELERRLEVAAESGVAVLIVRAGDFFGPTTANSWFLQMVRSGKPVQRVIVPGREGAGHAWAYLPDVAETVLRLVERRAELPTFARFHMEGFFDHDNRELAKAVGRVVGRPDLPIWRFPWLLVTLGMPFVRLFRELHEIRHLWKTTLRLDNRKLVEFLGGEPHTPIDEAVRVTLKAMGSLGDGRADAAKGAIRAPA